MDEIAIGFAPGMRDEINLAEARRLHIPVLRLDRDLVFQQRPRLCASVESALRLSFMVLQSAIDLSRPETPRGRRLRGAGSGGGPFKSRIAYLRWQPESSQNSSSIRARRRRLAARYRL